jgi:hypothetical protein
LDGFHPVRVAQVGDVEPGVVVEGLEALVPEELLDVVEVGVALDHPAGAGPQKGGEDRGKAAKTRTSTACKLNCRMFRCRSTTFFLSYV